MLNKYLNAYFFPLQKTECKAVIKTVKNSRLDSSGFGLDIWISEAYLPRMWVEKHPNQNSEVWHNCYTVHEVVLNMLKHNKQTQFGLDG